FSQPIIQPMTTTPQTNKASLYLLAMTLSSELGPPRLSAGLRDNNHGIVVLRKGSGPRTLSKTGFGARQMPQTSRYGGLTLCRGAPGFIASKKELDGTRQMLRQPVCHCFFFGKN